MSDLLRKNTHLPSLDGLRGIAILLVVFYHNYGFISKSTYGWLGVDLFFVLSGFLITRILIEGQDQPGHLKKFYIRRVLRIFPLYYAVLIFFLIVFPAIGLFGQQLQYYENHQFWLWTYLQNWLFAFHLPSSTNLLNHLWSLAVEEQFYLVWPILIMLIKNARTLFYLMLVILISVIATRAILYAQKLPGLNYITFYTFTRIDGLCVGSMVALSHKIKFTFFSKYLAIVITVLACFNFAFYFFTLKNERAFPYYAIVGYTTFAGLFGVLVDELVLHTRTALSSLFSLALLRFLGKISYGLYIFHWPVFILLTPVVTRLLHASGEHSSNLEHILSSTIVTLVAIMVSTISYYTFEMKFLLLKKKYK
ncbi:MAG: acyltransferase family protein [Chitinophagaceae bacterium]